MTATRTDTNLSDHKVLRFKISRCSKSRSESSETLLWSMAVESTRWLANGAEQEALYTDVYQKREGTWVCVSACAIAPGA